MQVYLSSTHRHLVLSLAQMHSVEFCPMAVKQEVRQNRQHRGEASHRQMAAGERPMQPATVGQHQVYIPPRRPSSGAAVIIACVYAHAQHARTQPKGPLQFNCYIIVFMPTGATGATLGTMPSSIPLPPVASSFPAASLKCTPNSEHFSGYPTFSGLCILLALAGHDILLMSQLRTTEDEQPQGRYGCLGLLTHPNSHHLGIWK